MKEHILYERNQDNSYSPAYRMEPIEAQQIPMGVLLAPNATDDSCAPNK